MPFSVETDGWPIFSKKKTTTKTVSLKHDRGDRLRLSTHKWQWPHQIKGRTGIPRGKLIQTEPTMESVSAPMGPALPTVCGVPGNWSRCVVLLFPLESHAGLPEESLSPWASREGSVKCGLGIGWSWWVSVAKLELVVQTEDFPQTDTVWDTKYQEQGPPRLGLRSTEQSKWGRPVAFWKALLPCIVRWLRYYKQRKILTLRVP